MEGHHADGDHNKTMGKKIDRGIFDFMKKKYEDVAMADAHKPDNTKEVEKSTIMEKLHGSSSNSIQISIHHTFLLNYKCNFSSRP